MTVAQESNTFVSRRQPENNYFFYLLGKLFYKSLGWKVVGEVPADPKLVVTAGLHTTNWDGFFFMFGMWYLRLRMDWMIKKEVVRGPFGWFVKKMGAMPIDRSSSSNTVDQVVEKINQRDRIMLVLSPEGTRRKTDHWKTGFYWIAHNSGAPLYFARLDYKKKTLFLDIPPMPTTGDIEADMEIIWDVFRPINARYPEKVSDMRLRSESSESKQESSS
jgi:1-acyl-sn-glycerol-3-phosphate acyltransferase